MNVGQPVLEFRFVYSDQVIRLVRWFEFRSMRMISPLRLDSSSLGCWKSSLAVSAPTPKSRDLAEDERRQDANRFLQSVAVEMSRDVDVRNLADC